MTGDVWDGRLTRPAGRRYRISLCTTCMGRLPDLARTLPVNLRLAAGYPDLEFVLLDYNSGDGLGDWVRRHLGAELAAGRVAYYRTAEPAHYSMTHSRNVAFRLATGDVVCNVDADNYLLDLTRPAGDQPAASFPEYLNALANQQPERAVFAKGRRLLRGRLGFFRHEFVDVLGGYDEDLEGYGHDDHDLRDRAWALGFRLMWFGGAYVGRIPTTGTQRGANMADPDWRRTERRNKEASARKLAAGQFRANTGRPWGRCRGVKNFTEPFET